MAGSSKRSPSFHDRREAGEALGRALAAYRGQDVVVLALPRGGVPVGFEVARALAAPLDVLIVRKLGVPGHEELAMGAIASGGWVVLERETIEILGIDRGTLLGTVKHEASEVVRRERLYRGMRPPPDVRGKIVILVDDGLATGATMQAALEALRQQGPAKLVVAVGVGAPQTCERMQAIADEVVCLRRPDPFYAVGLWYEDFAATSDEEVRATLALAAGEAPPMEAGAPR